MKTLFCSLTNSCNLSCSYCPMSKWRNESSLPHQDGLKLKDLKGFIERWEPNFIELTGGEPTLWPDYEELCLWLGTKPIYFVTKSNGTRPGYNQVSAWHGDLDHPPKYYDAILIINTGKQVFEKEKWCKERNIPCMISGLDKTVTVFEENYCITTDMLFVCPDGGINLCHEHIYDGGKYRSETEQKRLYLEDAGIEYKIPIFKNCKECKGMIDLFYALDLIYPDFKNVMNNAEIEYISDLSDF